MRLYRKKNADKYNTIASLLINYYLYIVKQKEKKVTIETGEKEGGKTIFLLLCLPSEPKESQLCTL